AMGFAGKVLMVTAGMTEAEIAEALDLGVSGVFFKHNSPAQLANAIRHAMQGDAWLDQRCVQALAHAARRSQSLATPALTERESQVLRGVFEGLANKEIGARLGVSEGAVKATLQHLFEKTNVRTRSQLVRIAVEQYRGHW